MYIRPDHKRGTNLYTENGTYVGWVDAPITTQELADAVCDAWVSGHSHGISGYQPNRTPDGVVNKGIVKDSNGAAS
jgi:hypothetical protein